MSYELILDQSKMRIGPDDGDDTKFLVKRVGEIICGGYTENNPCPKKSAIRDMYTLQVDTNNHWLAWEKDFGGYWRVIFRYPPRDEKFIQALKVVLESIVNIIP